MSVTFSHYPAGIQRCTNVEIMLNLVDDVRRPKINVIQR